MKLNAKLLNSARGQVFYGMHFYPGVAEYEEPGKEAFRVFINESTIRQMNPTFAGCPIFVEHVDEVDEDLGEVRGEADGWVLESFFNAADGKTWAKFIVVSDRGISAIRRGFRLSNAYIPKSFGDGGLWNGVSYRNEVTGGEFEHLAIVRNPRYEESVIMTPDEFKAYNEERTVELKRLANSHQVKKGEKQMGLKLFKRTKVENSVDLEGMSVELPLSKKEMKLTNVIEAYDKILNMNGYANGDHMVKVNDKDEMSVNDLVKKHMEACNEIEKYKSKGRDDEGMENSDDDESVDNAEDDEDMDESLDNDEDMEGTIAAQVKAVGDRGGDVHLANEEDEDGYEPKKKKMNKKKNSMSVQEAKKVLAREKAARLKNARERFENDDDSAVVSLPHDQVMRGKQRYGSN